MPRLSLYKPERGNDYKFIDRTVYEMFQVGGTDIHVHKYLGTYGTETPTAEQPNYNSVDPLNIQDLLFLENRDRKYDPDIYVMRGVYNVQDQDFNLSQFGLFLQNDTLFMTVHINNSVEILGRKIMAGDVFELPHLKDYFALNDHSVALKQFYVVEEINRASEGFSATWYPHLYRIKLKPITDSQEFKDILDLPASEDEPNTSLRDVMSVYDKELEINTAVVQQAEIDSPKSGYETRHYYTLSVDSKGRPNLESAVVDPSSSPSDYVTPVREGYDGYLMGDGIPPNGAPFGFGTQFPTTAESGDFFLRVDFLPNRLFRYSGTRWIKQEDAVRHDISNTDVRQRQKTSFINNNNSAVINGQVVEERQSLSQALKPKADL